MDRLPQKLQKLLAKGIQLHEIQDPRLRALIDAREQEQQQQQQQTQLLVDNEPESLMAADDEDEEEDELQPPVKRQAISSRKIELKLPFERLSELVAAETEPAVEEEVKNKDDEVDLQRPARCSLRDKLRYPLHATRISNGARVRDRVCSNHSIRRKDGKVM